MQLDHICHNRACVKPEHLRLVTNKQNQEHRRGATARSQTGVRGVSPHLGLWRAQVGHHNENITVGYFDTIAEAEAAVIAKREELFTHA